MNTEVSKLTLNDILKNIRLKSGLNKKAFADLVECDESYISNIERGQMAISEKRFRKMAKLAGYDCKLVIEGKDERFIYE